MTTATSLMSGEAMRNVRATLSGMPAATNPMKIGTELHVQNGVTAPRSAASTRASSERPALDERPDALGVEGGAQQPDGEDHPHEEQQDLRRVVEEEVGGAARASLVSIPSAPNDQSQSHSLSAKRPDPGGRDDREPQRDLPRREAAPDRRGEERHARAPGRLAPTAVDVGAGDRGVEPPERVGGEGVVDPAPAALGGHESGVAEDLEVVAQQVGGEVLAGVDVAHARRAGERELPKDPEAGAVRNRAEERGVGLGACFNDY